MLKALVALLPDTLNPERVKTVVRWLVTFGGAAVSGYFIAWGFGSQEAWSQLLANPNVQAALVSAILTVWPLIWGYLSKSEKNIVATAQSMPNVANVLTKDTPAGNALAAAVPDPNVVSVADAPAVIQPTSGS